MTLNWKARGDGRYDALASRTVGGKYFIEWIESHYSNDYCERYDVRAYHVHHQSKGGGGIGNIHLTTIRTFEQAKALAEQHHQKQKELIDRYGGNVPAEAWHQFSDEMLAWQQANIAEAAE